MKQEHLYAAAPPELPEIDDELAAMETANRGAATSGQSARMVAAGKILAVKQKLTGGKPDKNKPKDPSGTKQTPDRVQRRAIARRLESPERARSPHARLGRAKPVKSERQQSWELRTAAREYLSKVRTIRLLRECPEVRFLEGSGLNNVWKISQASTDHIRAIPGLGAKRRKAIYDYLRSKNVDLKWTP